MSRLFITSTCILALCAPTLTAGCKRQVEDPLPGPTNQTPDRLEPGEPMVGTPRVFGLDIPDGLRIVARFSKSVHLAGTLPLAAAIEAFQRQLEPSLMEFTPQHATWERVLVKNDESRRVLRIQISRDGATTRMQIAEVTPAPPANGLSDTQLWERAGRNPDGTPKDQSQLL